METRATRLVFVSTVVALQLFEGCNRGDDPPTNGSLQLFFDVDAALPAGSSLAGLESVEVTTATITALHHTEQGSSEVVLDAGGGTLVLPGRDQLVTGPVFEVPPGYVTQLRIYPELATLRFASGATATVRVPSGEQTGWKVTVDETRFPSGYEIRTREVTAVRLFLRLSELFHENGGRAWLARPTIPSELYDIPMSGGYDANKIVAVFDPATPDTTIDSLLDARGFLVEMRYPRPPPKIYKLVLPPGMSLSDAHDYLRGFPFVRAASPSARIFERQLVPSEGTPQALDVLGAETGWGAIQTLLGTVGTPDVVVAEISTGGLNVEHTELRRNVWLNEQEMLPVCGTVATCDVDGDGFVTFRDLNDPGFPAALLPADVNGDGEITCRDLLDAGSIYVDGNDDGANGFADDLCGWNFATGDRFVQGASNHDTGVAGIMAAEGDNQAAGGAVGVCWRCRLMVVVASVSAPAGVGSAQGATAEVVSAFAYARDNGAHVANFSAGLDLVPTGSSLCPNRATAVDKAAFSTVVAEMDAVITSAFSDLAGPTPLFTLAGGECGPGIDDGEVDYYDWPPEAFWAGANSRQTAITVAASDNTATSIGGLADYSNFGGPFEIGAPGTWMGMLQGGSDTANGYASQGTSFAAPTVGGVAALIAAGNLVTFGTPDGDALKTELLANDVVVEPGLGQIDGSRAVTMLNLP